MNKRDVRWIESEIRMKLLSAVSDDYVGYIVNGILDDVVKDVIECSAYLEDETFNEDDIRLAVGRVLIDKMNLDI